MYRLSFHALTSPSAARALSSLPRPVVHITGAESGLLLERFNADPTGADRSLRDETARLAEELVEMMVSNARTIVWDGQGYAPDSFTALILRAILREPSLTLVAFINDSHRRDFSAVWSQSAVSAVRIIVFTVKVSAPEELIECAAHEILPDQLVCFGGDSSVAASIEVRRGAVPLLPCVVVPVARWNKATHRATPCPIAVDSVTYVGQQPVALETASAPGVAPSGGSGQRLHLTVSLRDAAGVDMDDVPGGVDGELMCRVTLKHPTCVRFKRSRAVACRGGDARFDERLVFEDLPSTKGRLVIDVWVRRSAVSQ
jgi:hypothetical protein